MASSSRTSSTPGSLATASSHGGRQRAHTANGQPSAAKLERGAGEVAA